MTARDYLVRRSKCCDDHGRRNLLAVIELCGGNEQHGSIDKGRAPAPGKTLAQKPVYYQYTASQIEMMKRQAVKAEEDRIRERLKDEMEQLVKEKWESREAEDEDERMKRALALLMSVPTRILVEKFHWQPIKDENDRRSRLMQFCEAVVKEVNRVCDGEESDLKRYVEETYGLCGMRYVVKNDGANKDGENDDETEK